MNPITPYTDPALEHLAQYLAEWLNDREPKMVSRWIVSEVASYQPSDYPLLQLQCLSAHGESLEHCKGSIRYCLLNEQIVMGDRQQLGTRYAARMLARAIRQFVEMTDWAESPIKLGQNKLVAETRSGTLKNADGSNGPTLMWVEILFDYFDCSPIERC